MENKFTAKQLVKKGFRIVDEDTSFYLEYVFNMDNYADSFYMVTNDVPKMEITTKSFIVGFNLTEEEIDQLIKEHTV